MASKRKPALLRAFAAATFATHIALLSHVLAGGELPGLLGIVAPWLLSLMVCVLLAGRKLSLIRLSVSVVVSQLLFHSLFVLGSFDLTTSVAHVHGAQLPLVVPGMTDALVADGVMWVGHALAAAITVATLYRAEVLLLALRRILVRAAHWVRRKLRLPAPSFPRAEATHVAAEAAFRPLESLWARVVPGRAPPLSV